MSDFGGGIYLTDNSDIPPNWDLDIDKSGDVRTSVGEEELQKDISYATAVDVSSQVGNKLEPVVLRRIKALVRGVFNDDDRINNVLLIDVNEADTNTVEVAARVRSTDEDIELVFEV
jgi:hypothetical protein